ncbi:MAG: nuclear transport factor 2 family protein [Acidimicrobiia bacterium]|nr:nuclear transport factor 2 family protein [Acidimicrobiia bacterium]
MSRMMTGLVLVLLIAACSGSDGGGLLPSPVVPAEEVRQLSVEADAFAERHMAVWPDVDAYASVYAEDLTGADPSGRDSDGGKQAWLNMWRTWERLTDYTIEVNDTFISTDGAAYIQLWRGLWPTDVGYPVEGPRADGMSYFETFVFEDGLVVESDVWWYPKDNERAGFGCFAIDGCPALQQAVNRYVAAWTARDADAIAALYADEAHFTDSLLGLEAAGAVSIGDLADDRFGSAGELSIEVVDLFSWTDGYGQPSENDPYHGKLLGVTIHYRATVSDEGVVQTQEAVTTLEMGNRYVRDLYTYVDLDPAGLIHRETVYHEPTSLLSAATAGGGRAEEGT